MGWRGIREQLIAGFFEWVVTSEDTVTVEIADDGPGIPEDERETVLEASERGLDSEGEGLGLFLTRSILEQYGGRVAIEESTLGGASVELILPLKTGNREGEPGPHT